MCWHTATYFRTKIYFALSYLGPVSNLSSSLTINNLNVFLLLFMFNKSKLYKVNQKAELWSITDKPWSSPYLIFPKSSHKVYMQSKI